MDKVFKILYYLFFAAALVIVGVLLASALPVPGGVRVFVVQSGSMEPAIKTGAVVVVKPQASYKPGEVITFGPYSKVKPPTTHRIVEVKSESGQPVYLTKGDANKTEDMSEVRSRNVIGRVVVNVPYVGYLVAAAKQPVGFVVLVVLPAIIIVWDELKKIWQEVLKLRKRRPLDEGTPKDNSYD